MFPREQRDKMNSLMPGKQKLDTSSQGYEEGNRPSISSARLIDT